MLDMLIPTPAEVVFAEGVLPFDRLDGVAAPPELRREAGLLEAVLRRLGLNPGGGSGLRLAVDAGLGNDAWHLSVTPESVTLTGGDRPGLFYGAGALEQLLHLARAAGAAATGLPCGSVSDRPRFGWRGFMLDSARHFQSKESVLELIRLLARFRINRLHWHLTDSTGWRTPSRLAPELNGLAALSPGWYSPQDLDEITRCAREHFIAIVPELDMPGHSHGLLSLHPELACDPANPGGELCLGKPETLHFMQRLTDEFLELFPDSTHIHLGGDEAATAGWEECPSCRAAMAAAGLNGVRQLENRFMNAMAEHVRDRGRTPMLWSTESILPDYAAVQIWQSINEIPPTARHGNRMVFSVHNHLYFDYPATPDETASEWMPLLDEATLYATEPCATLREEQRELMLGVEGCLWTEILPQWRLMPKVLSRLAALSEVAWSRPENKNWHHFLGRKNRLRDSGYPV